MFDQSINKEVYLKQLLDDFPDGVFTINTELQIKYVNPAFCHLLGVSEEVLLGSSITQYLEDLHVLDTCLGMVAETGKCLNQETIFKRSDGTSIHISKNVQAMYDQDGRITEILVSVRDMTRMHILNKQLMQSKQRIEQYAENLEALVAERTKSLYEQMTVLSEYKNAVDFSSIVCRISPTKTISYVNTEFCRLSGYSEYDLSGRPFTTTWSKEAEGMIADMWSSLAVGIAWRKIVQNQGKQGLIYYVDTTVAPIRNDSGTITEYMSIGYDVTELVDKTHKLTERLYTDNLTKLPNRLKLLKELNKNKTDATLILLNIDGFKEINSFFGHQVGDEVLEELGVELLRYSKQIAMGELFKLPVDEYAVLIKGDRPPEWIEGVVRDIYDSIIHKAFFYANDEINLNISIGISTCSEKSLANSGGKELLAQSGMALKLAKRLRKPYLFYDSSILEKAQYEKNFAWVRRLRNAIDDDRVVNYYQPIFNARTLEIEKYECLVRIIDEDGNVTCPGEFLNVAKRVKLYHNITRKVIDLALEEFANKTYCFSVNISIEDITDEFTRNYILNCVKACPFADRIIFELLESEGIENYDTVSGFIRELKNYGAKIAIDDFGSGYSNFAYIMRLDVDYIKLDGSIIRDINHNPSSQVITETIVDFSSRLGISTIAEFVWNEDVCNFLRTMDIDSLQGYYLGKPSRNIA